MLAFWGAMCAPGGCASPTFVECGQDALDICAHFLGRRGLPRAKVALGYIAGRGLGDERAAQRLPSHMLVVGAAVNVYDVAGAMLHLLRASSRNRRGGVSAIGGASRAVGRGSSVVAKWGSGCRDGAVACWRWRAWEGALGSDVEGDGRGRGR